MNTTKQAMCDPHFEQCQERLRAALGDFEESLLDGIDECTDAFQECPDAVDAIRQRYGERTIEASNKYRSAIWNVLQAYYATVENPAEQQSHEITETIDRAMNAALAKAAQLYREAGLPQPESEQ